MNKVVFVGLDVHKESIVVATAPHGDTAVELYGQIGGTLDALDITVTGSGRTVDSRHWMPSALSQNVMLLTDPIANGCVI